VVALPIWLGYMEKILKDMPDAQRSAPAGVVTVPMQVLTPGSDSSVPHVEAKVVPEFFYQESVPPPEVLRPMEPLFTPATPASPPPPPATPPA
jgi:membrane carboxypeptidase/penicillin-binding protein